MSSQDNSNLNKASCYFKAYLYMQECIANGKPLDEEIVKELHKRSMEYSATVNGGIYRNHDVYIADATHDFPRPNEVVIIMKDFYQQLAEKTAICGMPEMLHPIELAAWTHNEYVCCHPFSNGNGRTARLLMNYQLQSHGYLPVNIAAEQSKEYNKLLDNYYKDRMLKPTTDFLTSLLEQEYKIAKTYDKDTKPLEPEKSAERLIKHIRDKQNNNINASERLVKRNHSKTKGIRPKGGFER